MLFHAIITATLFVAHKVGDDRSAPRCSSVYTTWNDVHIPSTICTVHEVGDACSATRRIVSANNLASTRFSVKYWSYCELQGQKASWIESM